MAERVNLVRLLVDTQIATPGEVAKASGCSLRTVRRWRSGTSEPTLSQFVAMVQRLSPSANRFVCDWMESHLAMERTNVTDRDELPAMRLMGLRLLAEAQSSLSAVLTDMARHHENSGTMPTADEIDRNRSKLSRVIRACEIVRSMGLRLRDFLGVLAVLVE